MTAVFDPEASDRRATTQPVALKFRKYQQKCIDDPKHVQIDFWCRQSGKDFTTAFKAVFRGLQNPRVHDTIIISHTQRQADLTFDKVLTHARALEAVITGNVDHEDFITEINGRRWVFTRRQLTLPTGARIIALPGRDPDSLAGYTAGVILTEFALFPDGGRKHWRYVTPVALTNGLPVWVITTPRGKDTMAYELRQNRRGRYSVRTVDVYRAVADGLILRDEDGRPCSIEEFKELYGDPIGWQTEYLVTECDDLDALIGWAEIERGYENYTAPVIEIADDRDYDPRRENVFAQWLAPLPGQLTAGWDIARKRHLSALWINEQIGPRQWLRMLVLMRRCSFAFQDAVIRQAMDACPRLRGCGDSTGLGMETNERLEKKYGLRWRGINFAGGRKIELASTLQRTWQEAGQVIPKDDRIACDLHALQREVKGDRVIIHETSNPLESDSHCDIAIANALALAAAKVDFVEPRVWTEGAYA